MRLILHVDMDAFYASIEQRDDLSLRGKPVIVGGSQRRGVVSTCSYEARAFGVHSAMPMREAMRRCPQAVIVPVHMQRYAEVSEQIMGVLDGFSPLVEPLSLDEAFLDMTGCGRLFGPPDQIARRLKQRVAEITRLTCSIGIAGNKFLAKIGSDFKKPDGVTWIREGGERDFLAPLPVQKLWGVGPQTAERLTRMGLNTIGEVARADLSWLRLGLGALGEHIHALANARDDRPVVPERERKSVGAETTLEENISGKEAVEAVLWEQCQRAARHLRSGGLCGRGVRVKIRYDDGFQLATRDCRLPSPCDDSRTLFDAAVKLLPRLDLDAGIRLVGVAAFDLVEPGRGAQLDLFQEASARKNSRLEHTLDAVRSRFGDKIRRGERVDEGPR